MSFYVIPQKVIVFVDFMCPFYFQQFFIFFLSSLSSWAYITSESDPHLGSTTRCGRTGRAGATCHQLFSNIEIEIRSPVWWLRMWQMDTAVSGAQRYSQLHDSDSKAKMGYSETLYQRWEPEVLLRVLCRNSLENDLLWKHILTREV